MKRKQILIGGAVVLCVGLAVFALIKLRGPASGSDEVSADGNMPTLVAVQIGALKRMTLHRYIHGYGTVEAAPATAGQLAAGAQLAAPTAGVVAKVNVVEGRQVNTGDVLVELNSGAATFDYAKAEVKRQQELFAQQNTSLKNLQDAESQLASLEIVAPVSGTVTRIAVAPGEAVDANTIVAEVIDLNRLAVSAKIPAAQAGELQTGEVVQILTDPPVTASLSFVSPTVDANDGTVLARASLTSDSRLRPGQFVQLKIVTAVHTNCLAAPAESVVTDENGRSVVSLVKDNEAAQTLVQTGFREDDRVEVEANALKEGDSVVTVGAYGLPDKSKIQILNSMDDSSATDSPEAQ